MANSSHASWQQFLDAHVSAPPLPFVLGMCHETPRNYAMHSHPAIEIVYHRTGYGVTGLARKKELAFSEGSVVIYGPEEAHNQIMENQGEDLCVHLGIPHKACFPKGCLYLNRLEGNFIKEEIDSLARGYPLIDSMNRAVLNLRATSLLMTLLYSQFSRRAYENIKNPLENHVVLAEKYIRDNFQTIQSVEEIANYIQISHDHLRHIFKTLRGKSLIRYVNEVRLERAKSLLIHSRLPMKQIASLCGFKDEYYFSAVFRNFMKMPPLHYRRKSCGNLNE